MMTKREFLEKLSYELGNMDDDAKAEILNDFAEHFDIAEKSGKTEAEICTILGDPREIAAEFTQAYGGKRVGGYGRKHSEPDTDNTSREDRGDGRYEGYEPNKKRRRRDRDGHDDFDIDIDLSEIGEHVTEALKAAGETVRDVLENLPFLQHKGWKSRKRGTAPHKPEKGHTFLDKVAAAGIDKIVVELKNSDLDIRGHDSDTITLDPDHSERHFTSYVSSAGDELVICEIGNNSSDLSIALPSRYDGVLRVKTRAGDVSANAFSCPDMKFEVLSGELELSELDSGKLAVKSASGDVDLSNISAEAMSISTASGEINMEHCTAKDAGNGFVISTGSGDVELNHCRGQLKISTGSGDICVENHNGTVRASSGSGDIEIGTDEISGNISYSTGSGEIAIACNKLSGAIRMASGSGDISFQTRVVDGDISAKTASGDIEIGLADGNDVRFVFNKHGRSGHLRADYDSPNGDNALFTVHCETHSGDIDVRRIR